MLVVPFLHGTIQQFGRADKSYTHIQAIINEGKRVRRKPEYTPYRPGVDRCWGGGVFVFRALIIKKECIPSFLTYSIKY